MKYQHLYLFDKFIIKFSDNLVGEGHDFFSVLESRQRKCVCKRHHILSEIDSNLDYDGVETLETRIKKIDRWPGEGILLEMIRSEQRNVSHE